MKANAVYIIFVRWSSETVPIILFFCISQFVSIQYKRENKLHLNLSPYLCYRILIYAEKCVYKQSIIFYHEYERISMAA